MIFFDLSKFFLFRIYIFLKSLLTQKIFKKNNSIIFNKYAYQLKKYGFVTINNFLSKKDCDSIIKEMDNFFESYPDKTWQDPIQAEYRIFGSEKISKKIYSFFSNQDLLVAGSVWGNSKIENLMTMANRIVYKPKNLGSGGGWHRDDIKFQYKTILYLVDTNENNGSFQLIKNSNKFVHIVKDTIKYKIKIFDTRISETAVEEIVKSDKDRLINIAGEAGTLIIVDTSLIHRGSPLKERSRYALTNYYYPELKIDSMKEHFHPKVESDYFKI